MDENPNPYYLSEDESIIFVPFSEDEIVEHDDGSAEYNRFRYSRKRSAYVKRAKDICSHTKKQWLDLCEKYDFLCSRCGCEVLGGIPTKDHIIPITWGGTSSIKNLQPLCRQCNTSKGSVIRDYR